MTLDEAIKHCLEVAEQNEKKAEYRPRMDSYDEIESRADCLQCAADHRQLAKWLTELKELRSLKTDYVFFRAEAKKLLGAALEDMNSDNFCCKFDSCKVCSDKYDVLCHKKFQWRYADEALKLIGSDENG